MSELMRRDDETWLEWNERLRAAQVRLPNEIPIMRCDRLRVDVNGEFIIGQADDGQQYRDYELRR